MNAKLCVSSLVAMLFVALAVPSTGVAQDDAPPLPETGEAEASESDGSSAPSAGVPMTVSFGIKGGVNMQGGAEVPDLSAEQRSEYNLDNTKQSEDSGIYDHFGAGPAVGGFAEVRFYDVVGLEFGLFFAQDNATGWEDKLINSQEQGRVSHDLNVNALHMPVLFKAAVDNETIKPFVALGPEFVFQQSSEIEYRFTEDTQSGYTRSFVEGTNSQPGFEERIVTDTSNYVLLQFNFGMEVDLGEVRIPFEIRTGFNPSFGGDSFNDRMDAEEREGDQFFNFVYDSKYLGHVGIYTGIAYDFDLTL